MIPPNKREAAAISTLAALTLMDPDPRTPDHDDSCISAARVVTEWVRRARIDQAAPIPARRTRRGCPVMRCTAVAQSGERCGAPAGRDGRCWWHEGSTAPHGQPVGHDGTVDVRALCARWDEIANRDAGPPRP